MVLGHGWFVGSFDLGRWSSEPWLPRGQRCVGTATLVGVVVAMVNRSIPGECGGATSVERLQRNLYWYRAHQLPAGAVFWAPTVFLYLVAEFGLRAALVLQSVYYVTVVVLEVPSGWLSDRVSRTLTLRLVAVAWIGAHSMFWLGSGEIAVVCAQVLLAVGYAFLSGTDVTLHFDTLEALGRSDEFTARESTSRQHLLFVTAVSAMAGGGLAMIDLRLPFAAALAAAVLQLAVAWRLSEPPREDADGHFASDLAVTVRHLRQPLLGWLALYVVSQIVVVHLAGELVAPYLTEVFSTPPDDPGLSALMTGLIAAVVATVAALVLRFLEPLNRRLGLASLFLVLALVPVVIVGVMALTTTLWVLPLLSFRRVQGAASSVIVPGIVGSRVDRHHRATFLSLTSLLGRLTYAGALLMLAAGGGGNIADSLGLAAVVAIGLWVFVAGAQRWIPNFPDGVEHNHEHEHEHLHHDHLHVHDDGHHDHDHDYEVTGAHSHPHDHAPVRHSHPHTQDRHHDHDHDSL